MVILSPLTILFIPSKERLTLQQPPNIPICRYPVLLMPMKLSLASPNKLGVRAVDDKTFEVTLKKPIPFFPKLLAHYTTSPSPKKVIEKYGDQWTRPENIVSNGAYAMENCR